MYKKYSCLVMSFFCLLSSGLLYSSGAGCYMGNAPENAREKSGSISTRILFFQFGYVEAARCDTARRAQHDARIKNIKERIRKESQKWAKKALVGDRRVYHATCAVKVVGSYHVGMLQGCYLCEKQADGTLLWEVPRVFNDCSPVPASDDKPYVFVKEILPRDHGSLYWNDHDWYYKDLYNAQNILVAGSGEEPE